MNVIVTDQTVQIDPEDLIYFIHGLSVCTPARAEEVS
jgi:hypothetical protein